MHRYNIKSMGLKRMATTATSTTEFIPGPVRIAVDRIGEGPLLVLLHGIGGNRTNWRDQIPVFSECFTAVAWDARGYGLSDDYEGPLDFKNFADDLERVLDHYGAQKAHLLGLSMGGRIIQDFYQMWPERVATLTLCDTRSGDFHQTPEARAEFVRLRKEPLLLGKTPEEMAPPVAASLIGPTSPREAFQRLVDSMAALHTESYIKAIEASGLQPQTLDISTISVPTLIVCGEYDRLTPPEVSHEMHKSIPGSEYVIIQDAGHLTNIENPVRFNKIVMDFLLRHRDLV